MPVKNSKSIDSAVLTTMRRWINPIFNPMQLMRAIPCYVRFFRDWIKYSKLDGAEKINFFDIYPCIHDKTLTTDFDKHYFYQDIWAFKKISKFPKVDFHVDVGSNIDFIKFLTAISKVIFIDIRPLTIEMENFESKKGNIVSMPFEDDSVASLSCLHVAEHIGLGRYGDPFDPLGTKKACEELSRILSKNGNLYFSCPVGRPKLCFNAHRIHSPRQIIDYFGNLKLVEFSGIDDAGNFMTNIDASTLENSDYACGLFHFTKV